MANVPYDRSPATTNTPEQRRAAAVAVATHAEDAADATQLLDALGLLTDHDDEPLEWRDT